MEIQITSKNPRQKASIEFLLERKKGTYESLCDGTVQVIRFTANDGLPAAAIFRDRKKDFVSCYRYKNVERMEEAIQEQVNYAKTKIVRSKQLADIKVDDILYTSWGYEQTNIDFYKVVGLVGKATALYVKIGTIVGEATSHCSAKVKPNVNNVLSKEPQRGRIGTYGVKIGREYASKTTINESHHASWGY